jgi:imidazole glycerol-phosphate synthase subunit HisH
LKIAVVDYGMGNLRSVSKALEHVAPGAEVQLTADPEKILAAERIVVPGQGAMPDCMRQLEASGARAAVVEATRAKPFLGICIGLQMLFEHGEEGDTPGLGVLAGEVPRFQVPGLKVPHIGWNEVAPRQDSRLFAGLSAGTRFYFVHSYAPEAGGAAVAAVCDYGGPFAAAVERGNLFGTQFHPEKSGAAGLALLANFVAQARLAP